MPQILFLWRSVVKISNLIHNSFVKWDLMVNFFATINSDTSITCDVTLSQSIAMMSESGHFVRILAADGSISNVIGFFFEAPPVIDSVTVANPSKGFKRLSIIGTNFKSTGVWCDFGASMTRPIHRGSTLTCPVPHGETQGTVMVYQDGQRSNAVNWTI